MVLVYALLLLPVLQNACGNNEISFRSSLNEGGKPILRGGESPNNKYPGQAVPRTWLDDLRFGIISLVQKFGYDTAKPNIAKLVDETEKTKNVLLYVKGSSQVRYKHIVREAAPPEVWPPTPPPPPQWLLDFKAFVKNLVDRYGQVNLDDHLRPVIKYVEKLNNVYIKDIDVYRTGNEKRQPYYCCCVVCLSDIQGYL